MKKLFAILAFMMLLIGMTDATYTQVTKGVTISGLNDAESFPTSWDTLLGNGSVNYVKNDEGYDLYALVNVTGILATNHFDVIAGEMPTAWRAGLGNKTISGWTDGGSEVRLIGPLESARFNNLTGYVRFGSHNLTGKIAFLKVKA